MSNNPINRSSTVAKATGVSDPAKAVSRDQLLAGIRSGRRLERVVDNIKHFLDMQVDKVENVLGQCEATVEKEELLQKRLAEFQKEKHQWSQTRMSEIERLSTASDELAKAWGQLENERRQFLDSKGR